MMTPPTRSVAPVYVGTFTLMREFTEALDRLFGSPSGYFPRIEFVRRNGTVRMTALLPDATRDGARVSIDDRALVIACERQGRPLDFEILLPEDLNPGDVTARLSEGMIIVEFPFEGGPP